YVLNFVGERIFQAICSLNTRRRVLRDRIDNFLGQLASARATFCERFRKSRSASAAGAEVRQEFQVGVGIVRKAIDGNDGGNAKAAQIVDVPSQIRQTLL